MTGDTKHGDAVADKWRDTFEKNRRETDLALTRLEIRAEQRSAHDIEEDTGVIHREALARQAKAEQERRKSDPPSDRGKQAIALVSAVKGWPQAIVAVALLALLGLIAWLKLH